MMGITISGINLECVQGNIANQKDVEAVVNAANAELRKGGGVAGAIHRAAGPELEKECQKYAPLKPGEAAITSAYNLPNRYVIHCLGPVYGVDIPSDEILSRCYQNALRTAEENKIVSLAFPAISAGAFGYPAEAAAKVAFRTILEILPTLTSVKKIRFVLYDGKSLEIHRQVLTALNQTKKKY